MDWWNILCPFAVALIVILSAAGTNEPNNDNIPADSGRKEIAADAGYERIE